MPYHLNMSKQAIARTIADNLDLNVGGKPQNEDQHDNQIEEALSGNSPRTEQIGLIYGVLGWFEEKEILSFDPDEADTHTYDPPTEWKG